MDGGNSGDPPPVLLSHGTPNPYNKWAKMWTALPFSQQLLSVLSMMVNCPRIIFALCIQIIPSLGRKASTITGKLFEKKKLPKKHKTNTDGCTKLELLFMRVYLVVLNKKIWLSSFLLDFCLWDYNKAHSYICCITACSMYTIPAQYSWFPPASAGGAYFPHWALWCILHIQKRFERLIRTFPTECV